MQYFISFLEGIITFVSPCLLPMIPIFITYFAGGGERKLRKTLACSIGFVLGFTFVFISMGVLAASLGTFLSKYQTIVNIVLGLIVIFFGLNYMGVFQLELFKAKQRNIDTSNMNFFTALVFGLIFSLGWTPCVGTFVGVALLMAAQQGSVLVGFAMLLCYSIGLGIPFILSAVLIDSLKNAFAFIKRNYKVINFVSGALLVIVGVLMAFGILGRLV